MEPSSVNPSWYQLGNWPLVGAIVVLLITNGISLWKVIFQARESLSSQLRLKKIEFISEQLSEFYNPIYSIIHCNQNIFQHFGPSSFPEDEIFRQSAGENWKLLKEKVVLPNNKILTKILREKSHLISTDDDIINYLDLNNHLNLYGIFTKNPTELYKNYKFPNKIQTHIETNRNKLTRKLNELKNI